ncbi:hypothetical protein J4443_00030 [Candidatus Woesearchaeota archaeon]|nr:hypothetical protein [Candidatus Woesearchaeota archaeon]
MNAKENLLEREKEIIRLLGLLLDKSLDFIVVGGYAIATYKKRFSVDLDLVVQEKDLPKFEELCKKEKYAESYNKEISLLYGEKFKRYAKKIKGLEINIDFLINGLVSRSTDASWSFEYIKKNSTKVGLDSLKFLTPEKELLIAMKLHSGRLSDIRDIVALMPCNEVRLKIHLLKGNLGKLKDGIKRQKAFLENPQFDDSFKGIFGVRSYNKNNINIAKKSIQKILKF